MQLDIFEHSRDVGLLALERQGRHAELVEGRRKLREAHPVLFACYMRDR